MLSSSVAVMLERLDAGIVRDVTSEFKSLTPDDMRELAMVLVSRVQAAMERRETSELSRTLRSI